MTKIRPFSRPRGPPPPPPVLHQRLKPYENAVSSSTTRKMHVKNRRQTARPLQWNRVLGKNAQNLHFGKAKNASWEAKNAKKDLTGKSEKLFSLQTLWYAKKCSFLHAFSGPPPKTPFFGLFRPPPGGVIFDCFLELFVVSTVPHSPVHC